MPVAVSSIESGIASAVISAARKFPSSRNSTTMTRIAPSARFVSTVRDRRVDELRAVEHGLGADVRRQRCCAISLHLRIDGGGDGAAVGADQHQRRADDDLLAVLAGAAGAQLAARRRPSATSRTWIGMPSRVADDDRRDLARRRRCGRRRARRTPRRCARCSRRRC